MTQSTTDNAKKRPVWTSIQLALSDGTPLLLAEFEEMVGFAPPFARWIETGKFINGKWVRLSDGSEMLQPTHCASFYGC
jgi:hypothetical protein